MSQSNNLADFMGFCFCFCLFWFFCKVSTGHCGRLEVFCEVVECYSGCWFFCRRHPPVKLDDDAKFIKSEIFSTFAKFRSLLQGFETFLGRKLLCNKQDCVTGICGFFLCYVRLHQVWKCLQKKLVPTVSRRFGHFWASDFHGMNYT